VAKRGKKDPADHLAAQESGYETDEIRTERIIGIDTVAHWVRDLWLAMVAFRRSIFFYNIEIVEYYLYGEINKEPNQYLRPYICLAYDNHITGSHFFPHRKMDSVVEHIASQATSNYMAALMPRGLLSFGVKIQNKNPLVANLETTQEEDRQRSRNATEIYQEFLEENSGKIVPPLTQAVKDYLEFGSCAMLILVQETSKGVTFNLRHIPFRNCYFYSNIEDEMFFFGYEEKLSIAAYKIKYGKQRPGILTQIVQHMYVPYEWYKINLAENKTDIENIMPDLDPEVEKNIIVYLCFDSQGFLAPPRTLDKRYDNHMVFTARNNERSDSALQVYGKGAALQAISSIRDANFFRGIISSAAATTVEPPVLLPPGAILNPDRRRAPGIMSLYPGAVNVLEQQSPTGAPISNTPAQILTQTSGQQLQVATEAYKQAIQQIENAFNATIFTMSDIPNRTATEIIERKESGLRQFKGFSTAFYTQLFNPLLESLLGICIYQTGSMPVMPTDKITITVYSFEDEQNAQIELQKLTQFLQIRTQIPTPMNEKEMDYVTRIFEKVFLS
jgi:hypothetical protein